MPQFTLLVPREKLPLLKDVLIGLGIDASSLKKFPQHTSQISRSIKTSANALFQKYFHGIITGANWNLNSF